MDKIEISSENTLFGISLTFKKRRAMPGQGSFIPINEFSKVKTVVLNKPLKYGLIIVFSSLL